MRKMSFNLSPESDEIFKRIGELKGLSQTQILQNALQLYSLMIVEQADGKQIEIVQYVAPGVTHTQRLVLL